MKCKLEIGDIITFSSIDPSYPGLTVTHRIVGKEKTSSGKYLFRTKGDNNSVMDPSIVEEGRVYGKVILKIPQLGKVRRFLTTSYGFLFGIVVPAIAIIVFDILKLFRKKDKRNCGFLYLRTLRTGSRALSLERGSLLDIILQMI